MDASSFLSILSFTAVLIFALFWKSFLPAYLNEKGKSLATKEDVAHVTKLVEGAKAEYALALEQHKATLLASGQVLERKRKVYEEICAGLRVFIAGHSPAIAHEQFLAAYALAWLWASDDVLSALNHFTNLQVRSAASPGSIAPDTLKQSYRDVIVAMRKDSGFPTSVASVGEYEFVFF